MTLQGTSIDHVAIAVSDLESAIAHWEQLGAKLAHREIIEADGVDEALLLLAGSYIQLVSAARPDSTVARFIERRGEGLHHMGLRVPNCAEAISAARSMGFTPIDQVPRTGSRGTLVAFLHPKSANGTLIELVQEPVELP